VEDPGDDFSLPYTDNDPEDIEAIDDALCAENMPATAALLGQGVAAAQVPIGESGHPSRGNTFYPHGQKYIVVPNIVIDCAGGHRDKQSRIKWVGGLESERTFEVDFCRFFPMKISPDIVRNMNVNLRATFAAHRGGARISGYK